MEAQQHTFELLDEHQAARILHVSKRGLEEWRLRGYGPPWLRVGPRLIRYHPDALRKWIEDQAAAVNRG